MKTDCIPFSVPEFPRIGRAIVARSLFARMRGLIGRESLPRDCGMLIERCNAVHTFFMRFPIHVVFLDAHNRAVEIARNVRPWTFCAWGGFKAKKALEIDARYGD